MPVTRRGIVPDQNSDLPTTSTQKRKRSSKAVRERKKMSRRIILNKFCVERIAKSLKINVIEIDGTDVDFTDAFGFFTWYLDNYARFDDEIPRDMVLKFREQYLAFNLDDEGKNFLMENIRHKQLFEDCSYEKIENSDSDESVYNEQHKTDILSSNTYPDDDPMPCPSPTYDIMSPVYCGSTDDDSSYDTPPRYPSPRVSEMDVDIGPISVDNVVAQGPKVLYSDYGAHVLRRKMDQRDFDDIDRRKKSLLTSRAGNVKIRYGSISLNLRVESIWNFCPKDSQPLISVSPCSWDRRSLFLTDLEVAIRPGYSSISHVVRMD